MGFARNQNKTCPYQMIITNKNKTKLYYYIVNNRIMIYYVLHIQCLIVTMCQELLICPC